MEGNPMWKKLNESGGEATEEEINKDIENVYFQLEAIRQKLFRSMDVKLRTKFMKPICNLMSILDYEFD
jgi:hypothetical protein